MAMMLVTLFLLYTHVCEGKPITNCLLQSHILQLVDKLFDKLTLVWSFR